MSEPLFQNEKALLSLIQRTQAGDDAAFEELLNAYDPMLKAQVYKFTSGNPALDRGDLTQEAALSFYRAVLKFDTAKSGVAFGLFAKICVHNSLVSHLRSKKPDSLGFLEDELPHDIHSPDPTDLVIENESYRELCRKVQAELSDYESKIWWLHFAGRTPKEIASLVGKDEKSVTNAIYRIRRKLRTRIPNP